jgi:prepilin-type N-terminal cleavage/methylation domain-containing protein
MARNRALSERGRDERGFTLIEIATVCAIVGILAVLAFPSIKRFNRAQETKTSATQMAGVLEDARSRAIAEATPHLVYVNDPSAGSGGGGESGACGPIAVVVRDADRSYTITDGDAVREVAVPGDACDNVKLYGTDSTSTPFEDMRMPNEDQAVLDGGLLGSVTDAGAALVGGLLGESDDDEEDDESSSSGTSGSSGSDSGVREAEVREAVVNGSTFPVDVASGRPVIAFSERGIPVDPRDPTRWGSGAGAVYLTDGTETVYAAVVQPMGGVQLRKYEPSSQEWR